MAYRGRVLVSMETTLGTLPTVPKKSVNPKQLQAVRIIYVSVHGKVY